MENAMMNYFILKYYLGIASAIIVVLGLIGLPIFLFYTIRKR